MRRRKRTAALTGLAAACSVAIVVAATGSAWSNDAPDLSNVATANTKSVGYAPASKLSVELRQTAVAQGSTKAESPSTAGLVLRLRQRHPQCGRRAADAPQPRRGRPRPTRPSPTRTPISSSGTGCPAPTRRYDYGTHFLFQGHEAGSPGLHHAHQPGRGRRAPRDGARDQGRDRRRRSRRSTARPGTRGRSGSCSRRRTSTPRPTRRRRATRRTSRTSPARSAAAATRASRTTRTGTSGSSRTSAARTSRARRRGSRTASSTATCPKHPGDLAERQAAGPPGAERLAGDADHAGVADAAQLARPARAAHLRLELQDAVDHDPRHRVGRQRAVQREHAREGEGRHAVQAARERRLPPGLGLPRVLLRRDRRHERDQPRERQRRRLDVRLEADAEGPVRQTTAGSRSSTRATRPTRASTTSTFLSREPDRVRSRTRATRCTASGTRSTPATCSTSRATTRSRGTSRCAGSPRAATRRQRSTRRTAASARTRATTRSQASYVSDGDPSVHGILGAKVPRLFHDGWRWFYTQQHGDNVTYEVIPAN